MKRKLKQGDTIWFWTSSSHVSPVKFVRWCKMRRHTGGEDTNKLGVGAVVECSLHRNRDLYPKIEHGLRRGQTRLRPYWTLYPSYKDAMAHRNAIQPPPIETL